MRQIRDRSLHAGGERQARHVLQTLARAWTEIQPNEVLRGTAEQLLAVHSLTAADAFQLAAALQWCQRDTQDMSFVTFDDRLRDAAHKEGFTVPLDDSH
jgi:predicted nucleic acid-binding protein